MEKKKYSFNAYGHENILGTHQNTIEFTKDEELTFKGDCIIGVKADFKLDKIREFIKDLVNKKKNIKINIIIKKKKEEVTAEVNPEFNDDKEMVIRRSNFICKRTFAINADKSCFELDREFINKLKIKNIKIEVCLEEV